MKPKIIEVIQRNIRNLEKTIKEYYEEMRQQKYIKNGRVKEMRMDLEFLESMETSLRQEREELEKYKRKYLFG